MYDIQQAEFIAKSIHCNIHYMPEGRRKHNNNKIVTKNCACCQVHRWPTARCCWYCTHMAPAIVLHLLFSLSLSAHARSPSARVPECQPGWGSTTSWKSLRLAGSRSWMKLWNAARAAGRHAWRSMLILGGYMRILKRCFRTLKMCSITLHPDTC